MPTLDATEPLTVREGQDEITLSLTLDEDHTGETLVVYLTDQIGNVHEIGEATGVGKGESMEIPVTFDVPPKRSYVLEVGPKDRSLPAVWPEGSEEATVKVREAKFT
jgi:hypothetical protein